MGEVMNIFEMAQKAGWNDGGDYINIERFAELVEAAARADEREACAKLCDENAKNSSNPMNFAENCATDIRARGTT
jgi:hypothetical protein